MSLFERTSELCRGCSAIVCEKDRYKGRLRGLGWFDSLQVSGAFMLSAAVSINGAHLLFSGQCSCYRSDSSAAGAIGRGRGSQSAEESGLG